MKIGILGKHIVHTWGGLGSQLFALQLLADIRKRFPASKICLVLHNSGVSERIPEIPIQNRFYEVQVINDFQKLPNDEFHVYIGISQKWKQEIKRIFVLLRILANCNTDFEFNNLRWWSIFIRGHYSHRFVNQESIQFLIQEIENPNFKIVAPEELEPGTLVIHYRLGDLTQISSKKPISPIEIACEISRITTTESVSKIILLSDSGLLALKSLSENLPQETFDLLELSSWDTLKLMVSADFFIGTNSKLSIWASIFRIKLRQSTKSSMPFQLQNQFFWNLGKDGDKVIDYY